MLNLNCTTLSQSESNIFMLIIIVIDRRSIKHLAFEQALLWGQGGKRPWSEARRRGEGKGEGKGKGKGGEPVEKLLTPLFQLTSRAPDSGANPDWLDH